MSKQNSKGVIELPTITYKEPKYTKKDLDEIFQKLLKYETDYSPKIVEIRKEQILKHSKNYFITDTLNDLANLIGQKQNEYTETMMEHLQDNLVQLHSPVIFNIPINSEPFHKWEEWTFEKLAAYYFDLMISKNFEDRYVFDIVNNHAFYNGECIGTIKNYQIIDMLNDLVLYDSKICGYEFRSFMSEYDKKRFLKPFNHNPFRDKVISVKFNEKINRRIV